MKIQIQSFRIEKIDYRLLKPIQGNLKDLDKKNYAKLKKSFLEKGLFVPVMVWKDGEDFKILDGHGRERLFQKEKAQFVDESGKATFEIPCLVIEAISLKDAKEKLLIISSQYQTITQEGFDAFSVGLDEEWIGETVNFDGLFKNDLKLNLSKGATDPDSVPEAALAKAKRGDIYQLGNHRLMCGSSLEHEDVNALLNGKESFDACITDPPYSVGYETSDKERNENWTGRRENEIYKDYVEEKSSIKILQFLTYVKSSVLIFSYPVDRHLFDLADSLRANDFEVFKEIVWVKNKFSFWPSAKYQQKHESILMCLKKQDYPSVAYQIDHESFFIAVKSGSKLRGKVPVNQSTVFEFDKPTGHKLHPTQKPIDLWAKLVGFHVPKGGFLYEPFGGSGTSIIASEMVGCSCYAMELSPLFCDTIIKRWEEFSGQKAKLLKP